MKVLFASSEAFPYVKTGGLADVSGELPIALQQVGAEVTLALPAYQSVLERVEAPVVGHCATLQGYALLRQAQIRPDGPRLWLIDHPLFSQRAGNPYLDAHGNDWADNGIRFGLFNQVLTELALGRAGTHEPFDLVHCHDWQTGLVPALLSQHTEAPRTVFTIHNLAYQGMFSRALFDLLGLTESLWSPSSLEFYGSLSFIKGGIAFAHKITTVSPTYAREIQTAAFAYGLEGLLQYRAADLSGILNGIDTRTWNPRTDPHIPSHYDALTLAGKVANKAALQQRMSLPSDPHAFVLGHVGRMVEQKGIDLMLAALPALQRLHIQIVIVGSGAPYFEEAWRRAAAHSPHQIAVHIGYDEALAHLVEAGADAFLMPSRFEPCGLNQMYSQAYGTPPIVNPTGGLADSVVHADPETLRNADATGVFMPSADAVGLIAAVDDAYTLYRQPENWRALMINGMCRDFSWTHSARDYLALYHSLLDT
ncbi:MAG: glycogen synthase GlgA [Thiotrichales bacterium]